MKQIKDKLQCTKKEKKEEREWKNNPQRVRKAY